MELLLFVLLWAGEAPGTWHDAKTGLTWAAADNGSSVTLSQARHYCKTLKTAGFTDWRLPEIDELFGIAGGELNEKGQRILAPIKLSSGWQWSATRGKEAAENWALDFGDGARASVVAGDSGQNRALCVRR